MSEKRDIIDCAIRVISRNAAYNSFWTNDIFNSVSDAFNVTPKELISRSRKRHIVYARFAAMHLLRKYRSYSLPQIGRLCGGRDHTSVIHGLSRIYKLTITNPDFHRMLIAAENDFIACEHALQWPPDPSMEAA